MLLPTITTTTRSKSTKSTTTTSWGLDFNLFVPFLMLCKPKATTPSAIPVARARE